MKTLLRRSWQAFLMSAVLIIALAIQPSIVMARNALPDCVNSNCNCSDFATQEAAQNVLDAFEGDRFRLDRNKDGIACQSLPKASANAAVKNTCPQNLLAQPFWYQTEPETLVGTKSIAMKVDLRNKGGKTMNFNSNPERTFQIWTSPRINGELYIPKYTVNSAPSGRVNSNGVFNYDLTLDLSDAPPEISEIDFRPVDNTFGTMSPKTGVVENATFNCN
ncbi:MAG: excalibur calcium-binding domain-containing protein [Cyanobacteria bacterium P01_A01_bin.83]